MGGIRVARWEDASAIQAIYEPVVRETAVSFEGAPPDRAEIAARMERTLPIYPWLVAEAAAGVVGYAYATVFRAREAYCWCTEVSVYVAAEARGQGVGRGLYEGLLALLGRQGFTEVLAGVTLPNEVSVRLHESLGFEPVGVFRRVGFKHGRWHDVGFWQLRLGQTALGPPAPTPFGELTRGTVEHILQGPTP